jgi:hypothetical protein
MFIERPAPGGFAARVSDLGRVVRRAAEKRGREVRKSVDADLSRIKSMVDDLETESIPAYAVFASDLDGIFTVKTLTHPVTSAAVLGARPYLRPLRAVPRPTRAGVLVADRSTARVFVSFDGSIDEICDPLVASIGKTNFGGFSGYDEHTARGRAQETASRLWKEAGHVLLERHLDASFDFVSIGGFEETVDDIRNVLHPYLLDLPQMSFVANPTTITPAALRSELALQRQMLRERSELALADELLSAAGRGDRGIIGINTVVDASNLQSISDLVVAGDFAKPGAMCRNCGFLARQAGTCPVCAAQMLQVDDVVSALMDATIAAGGRVHQISVGSRLDKDGIGAITRF